MLFSREPLPYIISGSQADKQYISLKYILMLVYAEPLLVGGKYPWETSLWIISGKLSVP